MTDAKKSLEKMADLLNKSLEDKRKMEQEIFRLNNLIIKKDEKIMEQHNLLCEHGLAEYGN
jgi:hypothetical protein